MFTETSCSCEAVYIDKTDLLSKSALNEISEDIKIIKHRFIINSDNSNSNCIPNYAFGEQSSKWSIESLLYLGRKTFPICNRSKHLHKYAYRQDSQRCSVNSDHILISEHHCHHSLARRFAVLNSFRVKLFIWAKALLVIFKIFKIR